MKKLVFCVIAAIGLFTLTESLTCNQCPVSLFGFCVFPASTDCSTNTSSCTSSTAKFSAISSFSGFTSRGCIESSQCNITINGTILGTSYTISQSCCSTDKCNTNSAGSYMRLSISAALSAAFLAFIFSQSIY